MLLRIARNALLIERLAKPTKHRADIISLSPYLREDERRHAAPESPGVVALLIRNVVRPLVVWAFRICLFFAALAAVLISGGW